MIENRREKREEESNNTENGGKYDKKGKEGEVGMIKREMEVEVDRDSEVSREKENKKG